MGTLYIKGIECYAYHGCLAEEKLIGQKYSVDVSFTADFSAAVKNDALHDTIDYVAVKEVVMKEMGMSSNLIEHVCGRILKALSDKFPKCNDITVRVTKFSPPVNGIIGEAVMELSKSNL